jgi:mono/diheme cytochrome c family protein
VSTGLLAKPASRWVFAASLVAGLLALAGCQIGYAPDMVYDVRDDLLVVQPPKDNKPTTLDPLGQIGFHEQLVELSGQKIPDGTTFNPDLLKNWTWLSEANQPSSGNLRNVILSQLETFFGKPSTPIVRGIDEAKLLELKEDDDDTGLPPSLKPRSLGIRTNVDAAELLQLGPAEFAPNSILHKGGLLYRRHCLHCHGVTGNGRGPTAPWVNPHPRDYRQGIFKFVSTDKDKADSQKPSREDLLRVLSQGVEGTSMPAFGAISGSTFGVLPEEELNALVSYVIHLSIRGQVEYELMAQLRSWTGTNGEPALRIDRAVPRYVAKVTMEWVAANLKAQLEPATVAPIEAQVKDQKKALEEVKAALKKVADAPSADKSKVWTEAKEQWRTAHLAKLREMVIAKPYTREEIEGLLAGMVDKFTTIDQEEGPLSSAEVEHWVEESRIKSIERGYDRFTKGACAGCHLDYGRRDNLLWDSWGTVARPANLTLGMYRGGRRPIDLYWRIVGGIPGAGMSGNKNDLKESEDGKDQLWPVWDVVNFVQTVPYPNRLPKAVSSKVYPQH